MGYNTLYTITEVDGSELSDDIRRELETISGYDASYIVDGCDSVKWYQWDKDMTKLSMKFFTTIFKVIGDGEESEDNWVAYFINGKHQHENAAMVYPEFDPSYFGIVPDPVKDESEDIEVKFHM